MATLKQTRTTSFGTGKREAHDASAFYGRNLYRDALLGSAENADKSVEIPAPDGWADRVYCHSSTDMAQIPDNGIGLAFTSPPYNVGKEYEADMTMEEYIGLIRCVAGEVYRVLRPGGRFVVNVANLGRKPYIPIHALFYEIHTACGFLPMGEIVWRKSARRQRQLRLGKLAKRQGAPVRDVHEYLLVFAKEHFSRPDKGESDVSRQEFMDATLSVWEIPAESARRIGHPAPFPVALAERVLRLYSYVGDVVLDPFMGSGTTCVAAACNDRRYVGFDVDADYCELALQRLASHHADSLCHNEQPNT